MMCEFCGGECFDTDDIFRCARQKIKTLQSKLDAAYRVVRAAEAIPPALLAWHEAFVAIEHGDFETRNSFESAKLTTGEFNEP